MANEKAQTPTSLTLTIGSLSPCYISIGGIGFTDQSAIDVTCLDNTEFVTKQPQKLKEIADISFTAFSNIEDYDDIEAEINDNQQMTITVTGTGSITFYGYLSSWEVAEAGRGDAITATGNIVVTNLTAAGVETGPSYASA